MRGYFFDRIHASVSDANALCALTLATLGLMLAACNGSSGAVPAITTPTPVTPSYTLSFTKTGTGAVTSVPAGIDCGSVCSASFTSGTSVTLSAAPANGYSFTGWGGACSGTGACSVSMTAARTVTATFTQNAPSHYTLSVTVTGSGSVASTPSGINCNPTCSASFTSGTSATLTASPASGYSFSGWGGACSGTGSCIVSMTAARNVTANFMQNAVNSTLPVVLFTDLDSGPNTGGESNQGAWVTIYGQNFGSTQGSSSVTVGGGSVAAVKFWSATKIAVQLGAAATTGPVVVNVGGILSNTSVNFTVRAGNIRCVSTTGSDSGDGLWPNCWRTVSAAVHSAAFLPGDIVYVRTGVATQGTDPYSAAGGNGTLSIRRSSPQQPGALGRPLALVAYPGETVMIGAVTDSTAIEVKNYSDENATYWTIANFHLQGVTAMGISGGTAGNTGWRVIGNDMYCPNFVSATGDGGRGSDACFEADLSHGMVFYGNRVHDVGANTNPSKLGHAVYWSTDSNHIDAGWNEVGPSNACRGIQFHSSPISSGDGTGHQQYDISVHDNYIHDVRCDGINFATVDPSQGRVQAYNNLLVRAARGPAPYDASGAGYSGIYIAQILNAGSACASNCSLNIYNNTMYAIGNTSDPSNPDQAAITINSGPVQAVAQNNIIYQVSGIPAARTGGTMSCATNLFFGANAPAGCTGSITSDPRFTTNFTDFTLQSNSPAAGTGIPSVCPATNLTGATRTSCNLGAF